MDFYQNTFLRIEKLGSNFSELYNVLKENFIPGVTVKTITNDEVAKLERMIKNGRITSDDYKILHEIDGYQFDENEKHPFMQFCPQHIGNPYILGNSVQNPYDKARQFALILKNIENGISRNEIECIQDYYHFEHWHDTSKYHSGTIYTAETMQSFLEQALQHFNKFYVVNEPLFDKTPKQANQYIKFNNKAFPSQQLSQRRIEISRKEMKELIGL